jgi:hypothetical protein
MHDHVIAALDQQRPLSQPIDQHARIRRSNDLIERVAVMQFRKTLKRHDQKKIMIAEHAISDAERMKRLHPTQNLGRFRAAIDQVTDEQHAIFLRIKLNEREQFTQLIVAALHIADDVGAHRTTSHTLAPHKQKARLGFTVGALFVIRVACVIAEKLLEFRKLIVNARLYFVVSQRAVAAASRHAFVAFN